MTFLHEGFRRHSRQTDCERFRKVDGSHHSSQSSTHTIHPAPIRRPGYLLHILSHSKFGSSFTYYLLRLESAFQNQHHIQQFQRRYYHYKKKTRQAGDTTLTVPVPRIPGSLLCSTFAFHSLLRTAPVPDTNPLFSFISTSNQLACITCESLNDSIIHLASLISLDP